MTLRLLPLAALAAALVLIPTLASARDIGGGLSVSATATLVSDYRFRGASQTNRDPAFQGSVDVTHDSGVYAGVWASNIADYGGATSEIDVYGGYNRTIGAVDFDIGGIAYLYPGGVEVNTFELTGAVGLTVGPAHVRASVAVAPKQRNLSDSLWLGVDARVEVPKTPVSITAQVGRERGGFVVAGFTKTDWSLGAELVSGHFQFGVSYVDSNYASDDLFGSAAGSGVVATVSATF